jgi:hypothetical protein
MSDSNDPYKKIRDSAYAGAGAAGSLAVKAATLAPLGAGAYYGFNKMVSNKDFALRGLGTGPVKNVNTNVGQNISRLKEQKDKIQAAKVEQLKKSLLEGGRIKSILEEGSEKRRALIASVLEIIDDPGAETVLESRTSIRDKLVQLLDTNAAGSIENEEKIISNILTTVLDSGTNDARNRFSQSLSRMENYSNVLQSPSEVNINGLNPKFNEVAVDSLGNHQIKARFNRVKSLIETDSSLSLKLMKGNITGLQGDVYEARIMGGTGREKLRLRLNTVSMDGVGVVRTARGTTTAAVKKSHIRAKDLLSFAAEAAKAGDVGSSDVLRNILKDEAATGKKIMNFFDYQMDLLTRKAKERGIGRIITKDFYAELGEVTEQVSRSMRDQSIDPEYSEFSKSYSKVRSNQMVVFGMEELSSQEQKTLIPKIVAEFPDIFDPAGVDVPRRTELGTTYTNLSLRDSGTFSNLRGFGNYGMNRYIQPVTAREQQFIGRKGMFVGANQGVNRIASTMKMSPAETKDLAFIYANDLAKKGRAHKVAIMNVNDNALKQLGLSEGEAYMGGVRNLRVREELTKTVLDLKSMKKAAPALYNELIAARAAGKNLTIGEGSEGYQMLTGDKKVLKSMDDFFDTFAPTGRMAAIGLSEGETGISRYQGMTRLNLRLSEATEMAEKGRTLLHVGGTYDVMSPFAKVFGSMFKGTVKELTETAMGNMPAIGGVAFQDVFEGIAIDKKTGKSILKREDLLVTEGAMLKKSSAYLAYQMIGGGALVGGKNVESFFKEVTKGLGEAPTETTSEAYNMAFKRKVATGVAGLLAKDDSITSRNIGMVFAGYAQQDEKGLEKLLRGSSFSDERVEKIMESARRGYAVGLADLIPGPQSTILRTNLASMEPRTYKFLQNRLQSIMGLSVDETSDLMTSFLARMPNVGSKLSTLQSMEMMATSVGQGANVSDVRYKNLSTVPMQEFIEGSSDMSAFLSKEEFSQGKGFILELEESARQALGKKQIFVAGGEKLVSDLPNILIAGSEGKEVLENEYIRRVSQFSKDLESLKRASRAGIQKEVLREQKNVTSFIKDYSKIFGMAFRGLLRGELRGSIMSQGGGVSLGRFDKSTGKIIGGSKELTQEQLKLLGSIPKKASSNLARAGSFALAETEQFLGAMKTYLGGEADAILARTDSVSPARATTEARVQAGEAFQRYFLGMEGKNRLGVGSIVTRNPQLASTHTAAVEIFRSVEEVGDADMYFKRFTETAKGQTALRKLQKSTKGKKINSFADIAKRSGEKKNRSAIRKFFQRMSENVSEYSTGEGGGRLLFPSMEVDVHYGQNNSAKPRRIDLSLASGMIGDFDGDIYQLIFPSRAARSKFGKISQEALNADMAGRLATRLFVEETKTGIRQYAKQLSGGGLDLAESLYEESLKEIYGKDIGKLDISLDRLRMGVVAQSGGNVNLSQMALGLLTALEEINLKSKKAPRAIAIGEELTGAVNQFLNTQGGDSRKLESVMAKIFKDTEFAKGDSILEGKISIGKINAEDSPDAIRRTLKDMQGMEIKFSDIFDVLKSAAVTSQRIGAEAQKNVNTIAMSITRAEKNASYSRAVTMGGSPQGAMLSGANMASEDVMQSRLSTLTNTLGEYSEKIASIKGAGHAGISRMLGPMAMGVAASVAIGSALGDSGYSPRPLIMPGEFSDARVSASIMAGTATDRNVEPQSLPQGSPPIDMVGRPINSGSINLARPNSFAMRGEVVNYGSISDTMGVMSQFGVNGNITINDHRRPITRQQMDRIFGD